MKPLIIYYSFSGNNKYLAEKLHERLQCDMMEIEETSVLIPKFIHSFCTLFPFCCVKILNRSAAMLANFALLKEKIEAKISRPI